MSCSIFAGYQSPDIWVEQAIDALISAPHAGRQYMEKVVSYNLLPITSYLLQICLNFQQGQPGPRALCLWVLPHSSMGKVKELLGCLASNWVEVCG